MEPEPTTNRETQLKPAMEPELTDSFIVEEEPEVPADQPFLRPPPLLTPLSPTVHPETPPYNLDAPWDFMSPALVWHVDSLALPRLSEPLAPPQTIYQSAPPWLFAPTALPGTVVPSAPPGSLILLAPPGSVVATQLPWPSRLSAVLQPSTPTALFGFSIPQASPGDSLTPVSPWSTGLQAPPSAAHCQNSTLVSVYIDVARSLGPSDFAWDSPSPCITSVSQAQVSTFAPPSISSAMGHPHLGCLLLCSELSTAVYSAMDSSIHSSMDSSSAYSTLVPPTNISASFQVFASSSSTSRAPSFPPQYKRSQTVTRHESTALSRSYIRNQMKDLPGPEIITPSKVINTWLLFCPDEPQIVKIQLFSEANDRDKEQGVLRTAFMSAAGA
ncbi:vegetative cell wall gp1-like protein [Labeo rohita]|uniref:Vegetative cell wall gp1-like protein n=1 Tax=Labeo rohita TaxID=84645 RepID=A0A498LZP4_LABRO|nr:vegetative cell wall gp1-like protein [Labeo rohita]